MPPAGLPPTGCTPTGRTPTGAAPAWPGPSRRALLRPALVLALSILVAAACGDTGSDEASPAPEPGRRPVRVVPGNATSTDLVAALIDPERVAAIPVQAERWARLDDPAAWDGHPRFERFATETILPLQPDLVFADAWQSASAVEALRGHGIPVQVLEVPTDLRSMEANVRLLGDLLDAGPAATTLVDDLRERLAALADGPVAAAPPGVLPYSSTGGGGWTAGSGTSLDAIVRWSGARNIATDAGIEGHSRLGFERLLMLDPDVVLVSQPPSGPPPELALLRRELASLRCVAENRIVALPAAFYSTSSHRMVDGAETLAALLTDLESPP